MTTNNIKVKECKLCGQVQPAYYAGVFGDGKTKIYTNADGQQWCGRKCPACQVIYARLTMQELRKKRRLQKNTL
jgi:hypothetical protein